MQHGYKFIRQAIKLLPTSLAELKGQLRRVADGYLPYSTGLEIECHFKDEDNTSIRQMTSYYKSIPNIMAIGIDYEEQRFRIPSGVDGAICLYEICEKLKVHSMLNPASGIHYHIDCTDISKEDYLAIAAEHWSNGDSFILKALESWGYKGSYNAWKVSIGKQAVRFHIAYQTVEFRIGEMTFDYELMMKRILHCQNIVKKLKESVKAKKSNKSKK